jgi:hypothetical protein
MFRISTAVLILLAGCDLGTVAITGGPNPTPGVDGGTTPGGGGMALFTSSVYSTLQGKCVGCHTTSPNPNFCAADATTAYGLIVALPAVVGTFDPATAPILTTIAAGHNGVTYATTDISSITAWLNAEKAAR